MSNYFATAVEDRPHSRSQTPQGPSQAHQANALTQVDDRSPQKPQTATIPKSSDWRQPGHQREATDVSVSEFQTKEPTGVAPSVLNVIILGASFGGLSCAHHFLDYTIDKLRTTNQAPSYRLILIGPSTHIYWNIGAPRALVAPGLIGHEEAFIAIEPGFHRHRGHQFTIIQGTATSMDATNRTITIECSNYEAMKRAHFIQPKELQKTANNLRASDLPRIQTLSYHALICCTGTSAHSDLLSLHGEHLLTADALNKFHTQVGQAHSIVICGGGCSGVEVAGQLATYLNFKHYSFFKTRVKNPKQITLITGGDRCLPGLPDKVSLAAEKELKKLGVNIKHNVRVNKTVDWFDQTGATRIEFDDDTSMIADVYVACTGVYPNSSYAPESIKDGKGYILTNNQTMRVDVAGERVYAVGDVASYSQNYVMDVHPAVPVVMHNLLNDLLIHELHLASPYGGNDDRIAEFKDELYVQREKDSQLCPISKHGGVGILTGLVLPKVMVHALKGHDYRVCKAKYVVVDGGNPYATPVPGRKYD